MLVVRLACLPTAHMLQVVLTLFALPSLQLLRFDRLFLLRAASFDSFPS